MKITRISKMGRDDQFAIFIDDRLDLILTGQAILDAELTVGKNLSEEDITKLKSVSDEDKLYSKALKYISVRVRSEGELGQYLKRKGAEPKQTQRIMTRLKDLDLINDDHFARAFIHDKLLISPASKRKITYELRKKQIAEDVIERSLGNDQISDMDSLNKLIEIKRRQPKFQDDLKLMQYLVRNGFNYGDVKDALKAINQDNSSSL